MGNKSLNEIDRAGWVFTPGGPRPQANVHQVNPGDVIVHDRATGGSTIYRAATKSGAKAGARSVEDLVITPGGARHRSQVHEVQSGAVITAAQVGHHTQGEDATRPDHLARATLRLARNAFTSEDLPALGSGYITYASWTNGTGRAISSFSTTWTVPPPPKTQSGQLLYLFNGLEDLPVTHILQPVLQWGVSPNGGGNSWAVASWWVDNNNNATKTPLVQVNPGDTLVGVMTLLSQSGGSFSYSCEFSNISGTRMTVQGANQMVLALEALECYGITQCSDYPATDLTAMTGIDMKAGGGDVTPSWGVNNTVTDCGQHTVVVSNASPGGEVDLFYRQSDWSGVADNWRPIGGFFPVGAPVSSVARSPNNLDLFITGNDGRVYTSWWNPSIDWSGVADNWRPIGGFFPVGAPVSSVARSPNNLDLFITGNDGRVYTSWWNPSIDWSGVADNWRPIGGFFPVGAPVSSVARSPNNLDLFITGNDGRVYTSWWNPSIDWSGVADNWRPIGGFFPPGARVSAVARTGNNLDLFITGNDGRVYTSWWNSSIDWSGVADNWRTIGGFFPRGAPVSAVARTGNNLDLFITGNDGRVYTSWWNSSIDWSGVADNWRTIGGFFPVGAPVSSVARSPTNLDLFITGNDGRVYTSWWNSSIDWSGVADNWRPIGGFFPPGEAVSSVARSPNNLDLFITGNDGRVYTSWWFNRG